LWQADLEHETKDLVELKFVLQTVATICAHSMDMELQYSDVIERYHTLVRYKVGRFTLLTPPGFCQRWLTYWIARADSLALVSRVDPVA
jgi:hypothetical protein